MEIESKQYKGVGDAESHNEEVIVMNYKGLKNHKAVEEPVVLVTMPRFEGKNVTIYPRKFPVPVVCSEFCGKVERCNLHENGFSDLCKHHHKLGKLVMPVDIKWSVRFNIKKNLELKARMQFAKSAISGIIPEIALAHERTEDSTFAAYSSQQFLDTYDDLEDGSELEYTMDTGMVSYDKSQAGFVPSFLYRTIYREMKVLLGFESKKVEKTYVDTERRWVYYPPYGKFVLASKKVIRTTSYLENVPVYKWIRIPTLRPIGCYLKPRKVVGSTTVVTRKERRFYSARREVQRQARHHQQVLIRQDEIDARKQVVPASATR
jgi:hypothetical protein